MNLKEDAEIFFLFLLPFYFRNTSKKLNLMQKLLAAALVLLSLSACKKSDTSSNTHTSKNIIIATENGVTTTYTAASGIYGTSSIYGGYVMNLTSLYNFPNGIELQISDYNGPLKVGTYSDTNLNQGHLFIIYHGTYVTDTYQPGNCTVTITHLDSTNVKGTFSGDIYDNAAKTTLTNGSFDVDLNQ